MDLVGARGGGRRRPTPNRETYVITHTSCHVIGMCLKPLEAPPMPPREVRYTNFRTIKDLWRGLYCDLCLIDNLSAARSSFPGAVYVIEAWNDLMQDKFVCEQHLMEYRPYIYQLYGVIAVAIDDGPRKSVGEIPLGHATA